MSTGKVVSEQAPGLWGAWQVGTYEWWPSVDRVTWSPELIRIYGLNQPPAAESGFTELVHPDDRVRVEAETSAYLGSNVSSYSHSFRIVRPDGAIRLILDRGAIERDTAGNVRVIRGINIDVTDQIQFGSSMLLGTPTDGGSARWQHSQHATPAIVFDWDIRANQVKRLASEHPILSKTAEKPGTFQEVVEAVHPADQAAFRAAVEAALTSPDGKYRSLHRVAGPNGAVDWIAENGCVEFDDNQAPLRLIGFSHVVTEQERLKWDSADENALMAALFESAPVGLGIWDQDFKFIRVNSELAAINGFPADAHIGRRPDELMPDLVDFESIYSRWRELLETGDLWLGVEISGETPAEPGRLRHWEEHFFPVRVGGRNIGVAAVVQETTQRKAAETMLRASEERYRTLFEAIDQGFCILEVSFTAPHALVDYRVVEANPAFYDRTGFPRNILGKWLREAVPNLEEHWYQSYGRVAQTGEAKRFEQYSELLGRWFNVYSFRIGTPDEHRVAVLFSDISERKNREEHTRLLMLEAEHRSKNMLGLVLAIARQTASSGAADFIDRFGQRVLALAAGQDLVFRNSFKTIPLDKLISTQLAHFSGLIGGRIRIDGPPLALTPDASQAVGMAVHELATNAAKYGALSNATGNIEITWSIEPGASLEESLSLTWVEIGGPSVVRPERSGFGTRVITHMVEASTGGQVSVEFAHAGLAWRLSCPITGVVV